MPSDARFLVVVRGDVVMDVPLITPTPIWNVLKRDARRHVPNEAKRAKRAAMRELNRRMDAPQH